MPYKKKTSSTAIETAKVRVSGMKSIEPDLNLGNGLSIKVYETTIQTAEQKIETYNTALANINQLQTESREAEKQLSELSERMLSTVAGRYGRRSNEYEKAGGTKRTSRRRNTKKTPETLAMA